MRHPVRLVPILLLFAAVAQADVKQTSPDGMSVGFEHHIKAAPGRVYLALFQIGKWWDGEHSYSGSAANLSLKADAGACFCERWKGGSVEHGRVILALQGRMLRLEGALGPLQGETANAILTFELKPDDKDTTLTVTYRVSGHASSGFDKTAPAVDRVLGEQLARFKRFVETGKPK